MGEVMDVIGLRRTPPQRVASAAALGIRLTRDSVLVDRPVIETVDGRSPPAPGRHGHRPGLPGRLVIPVSNQMILARIQQADRRIKRSKKTSHVHQVIGVVGEGLCRQVPGGLEEIRAQRLRRPHIRPENERSTVLQRASTTKDRRPVQVTN
jgi:hypothetical protein